MTYYDDLAKGYDQLHREEQERKLHIILSRLREVNLISGSVLDVGAGTGFSLDIITRQLGRKVIGVEPSDEMRKQYLGKEQLVRGSAELLPFDTNTFAAVISLSALHLAKLPDGLNEVLRVCKSCGYLAISIPKKSVQQSVINNFLQRHTTLHQVVKDPQDMIYIAQTH